MPAQEGRWTILVYIAAHNDLEDKGKRSLERILGVGSTSEVRLAALYDGPAGAQRCIAGEPGRAAVEEQLASFDSGDGDALLETVRWAFERCPAESYGLVLWSHGTGWTPGRSRAVQRGGPPAAQGYGSTWSAEQMVRIAAEARGDDRVSQEEAERTERSGSSFAPPQILFRSSLKEILRKDRNERAICFDDGTGHSLDAIELGRVMAEIAGAIGKKLDLLGMDACMMASLEVAYQVRCSVAYLVASEELVPKTSWPYGRILSELRGDPGRTARDLALSVVKHYHAYYDANPPADGDVTKVALDLCKVKEMASAVDGLAQALRSDMYSQAAALWAAQRSAMDREVHGRRFHKFRYHLWDLGSLAAGLATCEVSSDPVKESALNVSRLLQPGGFVLDEKHRGKWFDGIGGVTVYAPPDNKRRISPDYGRVGLAEDTCWDEMLADYHEALA